MKTFLALHQKKKYIVYPFFVCRFRNIRIKSYLFRKRKLMAHIFTFQVRFMGSDQGLLMTRANFLNVHINERF